MYVLVSPRHDGSFKSRSDRRLAGRNVPRTFCAAGRDATVPGASNFGGESPDPVVEALRLRTDGPLYSVVRLNPDEAVPPLVETADEHLFEFRDR